MSSKGRSILLSNGLTSKENKFTEKVIQQIKDGKNPNATQAALEVYDTTDPLVAKSIAGENLSKPNIRKSIQDELEAAGSSREKLIENVVKISNIHIEKASADTILKSNLELLKIIQPQRGSTGNTINIMNISYGEAKKQLETINGETGEFFEEAE